MEKAVSESWEHCRRLEREMKTSAFKVTLMKLFFKEIQEAHEAFAKTLKQSAERFLHNITKTATEDQNESVSFAYNYLCHYILNISHCFMMHAANFENKIMEPFELFCENFNETNKTLMESVSSMLESIQESRAELEKKQENYYKATKKAEKFLKKNEEILHKAGTGEVSKEDINMMHQSLDHKSNAEQATQEYRQCIAAINQKWENYDMEFDSIFENYDLNEESRINFTKLNISQIIKSTQELYNEINLSFKDYSWAGFEKKVKDIEAATEKSPAKSKDLLNLNKTNRTQRREEFVSYEIMKKARGKHKGKDEHVNLQPMKLDKSVSLSDKISMDSLVAHVIRERARSLNDTETSISTIESKEAENIKSVVDVKSLALLFNRKANQKYFLDKIISNTLNFKAIPLKRQKWSLLKRVGAALVHGVLQTKEKDSEIFHNLIIFLSKFYHDKESDIIIYLISQFKGSPIWDDLSRWENLMYYLFYKKKLHEYQRFQKGAPEKLLEERVMSMSGSPQPRRAFTQAGGTLGDKGNMLFSLMNTSSTKQQTKKNEKAIETEQQKQMHSIDEVSIKLTIFDELYTMLLQIDLKPEITLKILSDLAKKMHIDSKIVESLNYALSKKADENQRHELVVRKASHNRRLNKYGGEMFAIRLAMEFLVGENNLNVLLVCKKWCNAFKNRVYKLALASKEPKVMITKRFAIWRLKLAMKKYNFDYCQLKEKHNLKDLKVYAVEDIITMDVQRSFHNNPDISPIVLHSLLRLYAHYNTEISYCQGMNYIMGFLYYYLQNEEETFRFYVALMDRRMSRLFENDLSNMRPMFHMLNRLVAIFLPALADHFKKEKMDCNLYSSPWFITIFTNACQYNLDSLLVLKIWDCVILEGWKGFYKCLIAIYQFYEEEMLSRKFDELMHFMNNITKGPLFSSIAKFEAAVNEKKELMEEYNFVKEFKSHVKKITITNELLKSLEDSFTVVAHAKP